MSATVEVAGPSDTTRTPIVPGPIQGPTREEPLIEALLLDDYRSLVHLAYLILPPSISRARRVAAAHAVVQHALPPGLALPSIEPREFMRRRVVREATRRAERRGLLARLGSAFAPTDALSFTPCSTRIDHTGLRARNARGRRFAIVATVVLTAPILLALVLS